MKICLWDVFGLTSSKSLRDYSGEFLQGKYLLIGEKLIDHLTNGDIYDVLYFQQKRVKK